MVALTEQTVCDTCHLVWFYWYVVPGNNLFQWNGCFIQCIAKLIGTDLLYFSHYVIRIPRVPKCAVLYIT